MKNRSSANKKMPAYPFVIIALVLFWFALESVGRTTLDCQRQEAGAINCRLAQSYRLGLLARQPEMLADPPVMAVTPIGERQLPFSTKLADEFDQSPRTTDGQWTYTEIQWLSGLMITLCAAVFGLVGLLIVKHLNTAPVLLEAPPVAVKTKRRVRKR